MKKNMYLPVIQGMAVTAAFLFTEIILDFFGAFNGNVQLYLVDISLRILFGTIAIILLARNFKMQRSEYSVKALFLNKIPSCTYLLLLPVALYFILELLSLITGDVKVVSGTLVGMFGLSCTQQFAVGYFEEAASRALLLCGLLKYNIDTTKGRFQTIVISGICFGLGHMLNFFFGQDIIATLWQSFHCAFWGMFVAAIYMISKNVTLIMLLHAIWDIIVRIPNAFFILPESSVLLDCIYIGQCIVEYGMMTAVAIFICIKYDKLCGKKQPSGIIG